MYIQLKGFISILIMANILMEGAIEVKLSVIEVVFNGANEFIGSIIERYLTQFDLKSSCCNI